MSCRKRISPYFTLSISGLKLLCSLTNTASIATYIDIFGFLTPDKRKPLSEFELKGRLGGFITWLLSITIAGIILV